MNYLAFVKQFHEKFGLPGNDEPNTLSYGLASQRIEHMKEELKEYAKGYDTGNMAEMLDALVDLQYVLMGTVIMHGFEKIFNSAFMDVHLANMQKECVHEGEKQGIRKPEGWKAPRLEKYFK